MATLAAACHLGPSLAVTSFATALAVGSGRGWSSWAVAAAVLAGQLAVGWSNDYLDRHRDRAAGRTDKPIAVGAIDAVTVRRCALVAGTLCVPLSLLSGWRAAPVHLGAVAIALAYNRWLKNTVFSVVPYVAAFAALPVFVSLGRDAHPMAPAWTMIAGGLLGGGAHFVNTLPDLETDARTGIRGLPHRVGAFGSVVCGTVLLGAAASVVTFAPQQPIDVIGAVVAMATAAAIAGVFVSAISGRPRSAWTWSIAVAALTVVLYLVRDHR